MCGESTAWCITLSTHWARDTGDQEHEHSTSTWSKLNFVFKIFSKKIYHGLKKKHDYLLKIWIYSTNQGLEQTETKRTVNMNYRNEWCQNEHILTDSTWKYQQTISKDRPPKEEETDKTNQGVNLASIWIQ